MSGGELCECACVYITSFSIYFSLGKRGFLRRKEERKLCEIVSLVRREAASI